MVIMGSALRSFIIMLTHLAALWSVKDVTIDPPVTSNKKGCHTFKCNSLFLLLFALMLPNWLFL